MPLTLKVILLAAYLLGLASCRKPIETSRLQTLENIGSRNLVFEACSGTNPIHPIASLDSEPHLKPALAAIPYTIQSQFFDDLGGRIRIGKPSDCETASSRVDDSLGCWKRLPDKKQSIELIIIRSDKTKEQYTLVRTFGFIYVDILLNRVLPNLISEPVKISQGPGMGLASYKTSLASIFLGELVQKTQNADKKRVIQVLYELGIPESVSREEDFQKRLSRFSKVGTPIREAFASRVFAEAFHSQFCTRRTAERACKIFPQTMESFRPYVEDISKESKEDSVVCATNSEIKASASHLEWNTLNQHSLSQRRARGLDRGSYSNAKIAEAVQHHTDSFSLTGANPSLSLTTDFLQQLMGLVSGGLSGGGGGMGGLLGQLLGGLGGGGGSGIGDLSSLLGSLGLSELLSDGGDTPIIPGGGGGPLPTIPSPTPLPSNNSNPPSDPTPLPSGGNASAQEQAAMDATNRYRQSQGKSVLQVDQQMVEDCRIQAKLQAERGGLTHWLHPAGVARAENIAYGSKSGEYTVMQQWVKSPGHHANIMANHRYIGVGNFGNQWCQRFR